MIWNYLTFLFLVLVFIPSYNIIKNNRKTKKDNYKIISYLNINKKLDRCTK